MLNTYGWLPVEGSCSCYIHPPFQEAAAEFINAVVTAPSNHFMMVQQLEQLELERAHIMPTGADSSFDSMGLSYQVFVSESSAVLQNCSFYNIEQRTQLSNYNPDLREYSLDAVFSVFGASASLAVLVTSHDGATGPPAGSCMIEFNRTS